MVIILIVIMMRHNNVKDYELNNELVVYEHVTNQSKT